MRLVLLTTLAGGVIALASTSAAAPPTGPSSCSSKGVRSTLVAFTRAFDRGDYEALDSIFAEKPDFQWYATNGRFGRSSRRRNTLIRYFRARHARGERLSLTSFGFNGNSPRYGNFEMTMRRSIRGVDGGDWLRIPGKGAAVCAGGSTRLIVISFALVPTRKLGGLNL